MKKDEQGRPIFKKSFFVRNLWGVNTILVVCNIFFKESVKPDYPENSWNFFWGTFLAPLAWLLAFFFFFPIIALSEFCFYLFSFLSRKIPASILSLLFIAWLACKNNFAVLKATPSAVWWFIKSVGPWIIAFDVLLVILMIICQSENWWKIRKSIKQKICIPIVFEEEQKN